MEFIREDDVEKFAQRYVQRLEQLLESLDLNALALIIDQIERVRAEGKTIYLIGNGGSAATASHMAEDLAFGTRMREGERIKALSLTDNQPYVMAAANDIGYDSIFEEQLKNLMLPGDLLIAISASGNSPNVVKAVDYANRHGGISVGLVGFDGGQLRESCHIVLHVETQHGEYGPVEDIHLILDHIITEYLIQAG
ncbi:MAG: SIS domain-containing protein [Anaerolineaceae bacterium]|nr:MAG: SIS domain-containing protein [Anaerolineaceae bacterium]